MINVNHLVKYVDSNLNKDLGEHGFNREDLLSFLALSAELIMMDFLSSYSSDTTDRFFGFLDEAVVYFACSFGLMASLVRDLNKTMDGEDVEDSYDWIRDRITWYKDRAIEQISKVTGMDLCVEF